MPAQGTMSETQVGPRTIAWIGDTDGYVRLIDQTSLPARLEYRDCRTVEELWEAIRTLRVRGAPPSAWRLRWGWSWACSGFAVKQRGAYGSSARSDGLSATSRPTAVNLFWALERMERHVQAFTEEWPPERLTRWLLEEALVIEDEDRRMCRAIGDAGAHSSARGKAY